MFVPFLGWHYQALRPAFIFISDFPPGFGIVNRNSYVESIMPHSEEQTRRHVVSL